MKKSLYGAGIVVAVLATSSAFAGSKGGGNVVVDSVSRTASGSLGNARNSSDTTQSIGCTVSVNPATSTTPSVQCAARDSTGKVGSCTSKSAAHIQVMAAMNSDSAVNFSWDAAGNCLNLSIGTQSNWAPKVL